MDQIKKAFTWLFKNRRFGLRYWGPNRFFWLNLVYLVVLGALLVGRGRGWDWISWIEDPIGGLIPIGVPWFGALGAVTISIYGVFDWNREWDKKWNYWHAARPGVGAILATVSFIIFVGVINATGTSATAEIGTSVNAVPYLALAFIVGYREETFRQLIKRAADTLLGPGIPGQTLQQVSLTTRPTEIKDLAVNASLDVDVMLANQGGGQVATAEIRTSVDPEAAAVVTVAEGLENVVIAASGFVQAKATIERKTADAFDATITVTGSFGERRVTLVAEAVG